MRGDLGSDGHPVGESRLLAIPLLVDTEDGATSPDDRLLVDLVHTALQRAYRGDEPLVPDAFVVNFSIGVRVANFAGRISSLARLLDWWSSEAGILFVVSAGNVGHDLEIPETTLREFENLSQAERHEVVRTVPCGEGAMNVPCWRRVSRSMPLPSARRPWIRSRLTWTLRRSRSRFTRTGRWFLQYPLDWALVLFGPSNPIFSALGGTTKSEHCRLVAV